MLVYLIVVTTRRLPPADRKGERTRSWLRKTAPQADSAIFSFSRASTPMPALRPYAHENGTLQPVA
jgi:hypothetical protein